MDPCHLHGGTDEAGALGRDQPVGCGRGGDCDAAGATFRKRVLHGAKEAPLVEGLDQKVMRTGTHCVDG